MEISRYVYKPDFIDISLIDLGPGEFIGLFQNAEYICTNSYHGFVFSILFQKRFCLIPCKRFRLRIENLAALLEITLPDMGRSEEPQDTYYDNAKGKSILAREREKSICYLRQNLIKETI